MILYLGNKLSKHGFTPTSVETLGPRLESLGIETILLSEKKNPAARLFDMLAGIIRYRKRRPVVLIDTYSTSAFWFSYAAGWLCSVLKLNYIPILRGGDLPGRLDSSPRASRKLFGNAFHNIAVSGYLYTEFANRNYKSVVIHNFIDIQLYPFRLRKNVKPTILWVRAFHTIYNPLLAIRAIHKVRAKYPEATLCMVGPDKDGSLATCKELAQSLGIPVRFTGRLSKTEWVSMAAEYDIFLNTTHVDNTPVSVMEAMAMGMPVVTTNAGGIPHLFKNGDEGIMVAVNDEQAISEAIFSLLEQPGRAEAISIAARAKAEKWDWKVISPQWKNLLVGA